MRKRFPTSMDGGLVNKGEQPEGGDKALEVDWGGGNSLFRSTQQLQRLT